MSMMLRWFLVHIYRRVASIVYSVAFKVLAIVYYIVGVRVCGCVNYVTVRFSYLLLPVLS